MLYLIKGKLLLPLSDHDPLDRYVELLRRWEDSLKSNFAVINYSLQDFELWENAP